MSIRAVSTVRPVSTVRTVLPLVPVVPVLSLSPAVVDEVDGVPVLDVLHGAPHARGVVRVGAAVRLARLLAPVRLRLLLPPAGVAKQENDNGNDNWELVLLLH